MRGIHDRRQITAATRQKSNRVPVTMRLPSEAEKTAFSEHCGVYREEREPKVARVADTRRLAICSVR